MTIITPSFLIHFITVLLFPWAAAIVNTPTGSVTVIKGNGAAINPPAGSVPVIEGNGRAVVHGLLLLFVILIKPHSEASSLAILGYAAECRQIASYVPINSISKER